MRRQTSWPNSSTEIDGVPQVYIRIPTAWTFAKIKEGASIDAINAYFASIGKPAVSIGGPNPFWEYVLELGVTGNVDRSDDPAGLASFGPIGRTSFLDFAPIGLTLLVGGEVEGLPIWFEVDAAAFGDAVPEAFPGAAYVDADGVERPRTWETWNDGHHEPLGPWHSRYYVPGNSMGSELPASIWHPTYSNPPAGVRAISQSEFVRIQQANSEPIA